MNMRKIIISISVILSTMLLLTACGGGGDKPGIAIGPPASGTNSFSKHLFGAYDLEDDDYTEFQEGFSDAADGIQDGNIEMLLGILGLPAGSIESLQASVDDVKMLGFSDDAIDYLEEHSGYERYTIPKDTYDFLDEDVDTVAAYALMVANTDTVSEEVGYELAKIMIENSDENTHAQAAQMTLDNALNGAEDIPIHPGAAKYFEEQGLEFDNPIAELNVSEEKSDLVLGTGSQGGTYYPLGGEIANVWNNHLDNINVTNTETGASVENLAHLRDGSVDLGMAVNVPTLEAINGEGDFEEEVDNIAFIGHIYPEVVQLVTREETGIESLGDLKQE